MSRRGLYVLVAITAVGAFVRFATLGVQSYDHDEAVTAARSFIPASLLDPQPGRANDPLSYYLGVEQWHKGGAKAVRTDVIPVLSTTYEARRPHGPFRLAKLERMAPDFFLWLYEAKRPHRVRLRDLGDHRVLGERSSVLVREAP